MLGVGRQERSNDGPGVDGAVDTSEGSGESSVDRELDAGVGREEEEDGRR